MFMFPPTVFLLGLDLCQYSEVLIKSVNFKDTRHFFSGHASYGPRKKQKGPNFGKRPKKANLGPMLATTPSILQHPLLPFATHLPFCNTFPFAADTSLFAVPSLLEHLPFGTPCLCNTYLPFTPHTFPFAPHGFLRATHTSSLLQHLATPCNNDLQQLFQCWCGNEGDVDRHGDGVCDMKCSDGDYACGGSYATTTYESKVSTSDDWTYEGCYHDDKSDRILTLADDDRVSNLSPQVS